MAEPVGDDETFSRGLEQARAALGRAVPRHRPGPRPVPDPDDAAVDGDPLDDRDVRIAALEAEVRRLRAALARVHEESGRSLDQA